MTNKSVTQEVVPYKNYEIKARCDGKYDFVSTHYFTPGTPSYDVSMTDYDGFDYVYNQFNDSILDLSNTVLPWKWDYSTALSSKYFSLFNTDKFKVVYSYTKQLQEAYINGSASLSSDFILSNVYYTNRYLQIYHQFDFSNPFTLTFPYKADGYPSGWPLKSNTDKSLDIWSQNSIIVAIGNGSSYHDINLGSPSIIDGLITIVWDGSTYTARYDGTDGTVLTGTYSSTTAIPNTEMMIGYTYAYNPSYYDLKQFTFVSNGSTYKLIDYGVSGYKKAQGCLYNYTDDGSAVTLNCFTSDKDKGIILTPDSTYNDERLLGTVDIPAHTVEEYVTTTFDITPSDAEYLISVPLDAYDPEEKSITTCKDIHVTCSVSKEGYDMKTISITPTETSTQTITLDAANTWLDVTGYSYDRDENDLVTLWYQGDDEDVTIPEIQGRSE